jgi:hypothetical protein
VKKNSNKLPSKPKLMRELLAESERTEKDPRRFQMGPLATSMKTNRRTPRRTEAHVKKNME